MSLLFCLLPLFACSLDVSDLAVVLYAPIHAYTHSSYTYTTLGTHAPSYFSCVDREMRGGGKCMREKKSLFCCAPRFVVVSFHSSFILSLTVCHPVVVLPRLFLSLSFSNFRQHCRSDNNNNNKHNDNSNSVVARCHRQ